MSVPFRWDLVTLAQLGTLLNGIAPPNIDFAPELAQCAGRVLARSGNGDLVFVGRSLDSMYDLLSGALSGLDDVPALQRVPLSFAGVRQGALPDNQTRVARSIFAQTAITPYALARRARPVTFVDVVATGDTFGHIHSLLRTWIDEDRASWDVIRTRIRFLAVTSRTKTSPNTWRWSQHNPWTRDLPGDAVISVSLDRFLWSYLVDYQLKLTRSYSPDRWTGGRLKGRVRAVANAPGRPSPRQWHSLRTVAARPGGDRWRQPWRVSPHSRTPGYGRCSAG